jgi:hypothetical protein
MQTVSKQTRLELVKALRERYRLASKQEKGRILNEFVVISGHHRKHAIRLLQVDVEAIETAPIAAQRIYDEAVKQTVIVLWEAADRICSKRLKAAIPTLLTAMESHGHLQLELKVRERVLSASPATIDRLLSSIRKSAGSRRKKKLIKRVSKEIPIKTHHDWKDPLPGYLEIDFVVHGGGSMSGEFLHTLVATDVCSGWTEAVPLLAREQSLVVEGLKRIQTQMPVPILGIDSDNDSAFINDTLATFCQQEKITFTRSRAYRKNDQAWIEQKNGAVIRKIIGHERFSGIVAGQALAQLLQAVRLHVNYFQPSFKLRERVREGGKMKKVYYPPATPCDRLLAHAGVGTNAKNTLRDLGSRLDPVALLQRIRQGQSALAALSSGVPGNGPERQSLEEFLSGLSSLWELGEVRATHRKESAESRSWRTREDPFTGVWVEILSWLQKEPDCTAKTIMQRLNEKYPEQHNPNQLRTLQRRVGEWRQSMARKLILFGVPEGNEIEPISAPVESNPGEVPLRLATLASAPPPPDLSAASGG